jgi:hypothetical protein
MIKTLKAFKSRSSSVADPDPGSGTWCLFGPSGMGKKSKTFRIIKTIFLSKILKFFDVDPGSLDPVSGIKILDLGSGLNIPDPQHCIQDFFFVFVSIGIIVF